MTKPGYIRLGIDKKVYFEYYELPKPKWCKIINTQYQMDVAMRKYEASKREVEVEDATKPLFGYSNVFLKDKNSSFPKTINVTDNQPCMAKIENYKAEIIKIL